MKISARNELTGCVMSIRPGAVNGSVKVDLGQGLIVTANIIEEAIADLALEEDDAYRLRQGERRADRQMTCASAR